MPSCPCLRMNSPTCHHSETSEQRIGYAFLLSHVYHQQMPRRLLAYALKSFVPRSTACLTDDVSHPAVTAACSAASSASMRSRSVPSPSYMLHAALRTSSSVRFSPQSVYDMTSHLHVRQASHLVRLNVIIRHRRQRRPPIAKRPSSFHIGTQSVAVRFYVTRLRIYHYPRRYHARVFHKEGT